MEIVGMDAHGSVVVPFFLPADSLISSVGYSLLREDGQQPIRSRLENNNNAPLTFQTRERPDNDDDRRAQNEERELHIAQAQGVATRTAK